MSATDETTESKESVVDTRDPYRYKKSTGDVRCCKPPSTIRSARSRIEEHRYTYMKFPCIEDLNKALELFTATNKCEGVEVATEVPLAWEKYKSPHGQYLPNSVPPPQPVQQPVVTVGSQTASKEVVIDPCTVKIFRPIASGTFGQVYIGTWEEAPVTIKISEFSDPASQAGVLCEISMLRKSASPNVVSLYGAYSCSNEWRMVLEPMLCDLETVLYKPDEIPCSLYKYTKPFNLLNRLWAAHYVASGINAAHESGIIHCDVNPANFLLDFEFSCKLADFGLSVQIPSGHSRSQPFTGSLRGKLIYLAPEVLKYGQLSERSDFWSFGVLLTAILSQEPPYSNAQKRGVPVTCQLLQAPLTP
ncbi:Protein kinase domain [Pelomyxa schiedti]|nr:Protein kinase domain [Pelomyxa schiedti]